MAPRYGWPVALTIAALAVMSIPAVPRAARQAPAERRRLPDFDIRDSQPAAGARVHSEATPQGFERRRDRLNRDSGSLRVLDRPDLSVDAKGDWRGVGRRLAAGAARLGLTPADLASLVVVRDYTTRGTGVRHLLMRQVVDGHQVFDSAITIHIAADGRVLRVTSNAAPSEGRNPTPLVDAPTAAIVAAQHAAGASQSPSLVWLPVAGTLRLAWHVVVAGEDDVADVVIDAQSSELLIRRSRARDASAAGRIFQSDARAAATPRQPDPMPLGAGSQPACPPPANYQLRAFDAPFRAPSTIVADSGRLEGNNAQVFRGAGGAAATGTPAGGGWLFDFPLHSAASAETSLFFAANFAHDFFYDLGFDEAAGNFQADNFGRGGVGNDPLHLNARAPGRNNANYVHAPDGSSPTINMFLWDGAGCWGNDVDGDGSADLDGDYDLDILVHEFHHGVSLRLNTAFTGNEAGAIGEGGGDFFAYSVNGDPVLAEYARPGGLRAVNGKGYADWSCLLGLFCEVHDNGEIWANVLWDLRERLRADNVHGSAAAAVNEAHLLYVDALALSPPAPTMLDMRDAILLADTTRNPQGSSSANFCRIWESFAGRGMGASALDTADSGLSQVTAAYDVPTGCTAPPGPPAVSIAATVATASEAGTTPAIVTVRRDTVSNRPLTVSLFTGGSAASGVDYVALAPVTIPADATEVTLSIVPIDDTLLENNETVTLTVRAGAGYIVGSPSVATVTIVSDDVAPDLTISTLTVPAKGAPGGVIGVSDTTRNQGSGASTGSQTAFYLSRDVFLDAGDTSIGSRPVEPLAIGAASSATISLTLPDGLATGTYFLFAKADGPGEVTELNESNNVRASAISIGPDLLVTTFTAPAAAAAGSAIVVSDTTTNQGSAPVAASVTSFYLSANVTFETSDTLLQSRSVPALAAGGSSAATTAVTLPASLATGTYYVIAQADGPGAVTELNEVNNSRAAAVRVGPDLVGSSLTAPTRAAAGGTFADTETTANNGSSPAGTTTTAFYLSLNITLDPGDIRLSPARAVPALAANQSSTATTTLALPSQLAAGSWYVIASADDAASVPETLETNNVRFASVLVGPDLMFGLASAPSTAASGSVIAATSTVRNAGAATAPPTTIRFYLSANMSLDAGDVVLDAVQAVPTLAADGSFTATSSIALPGDRSGTFYLLFVADADQAVVETSEANNLAVRVLTLSSR
jgi:subtilase family serine protease